MSHPAWWTSTDWDSLDDHQVAVRVDRSVETVRKARKIMAPETMSRPRLPRDVDWGMTDVELSAEHGGHRNSWGRRRRTEAPETVRPRGRPIESQGGAWGGWSN